MSATVRWTGLDDFRRQLMALPETLTMEARGIVTDTAEAAQDAMMLDYPRRSGDLRLGLQVQTVASGRFGAAARLRNRAHHADIFEHGTQARHTSIGANRGSMPAGNVFIPQAIRHRRRMMQELITLVERHGLTVKGGR